MPAARGQWVCKAPNAFRPERLLSRILLEPWPLQPQRKFTCSSLLQQVELDSAVAGPLIETPTNVEDETRSTGNDIQAFKTRRIRSRNRSKAEEAKLFSRHVENIDPSSLAHTLQMHRDANKAALPIIRKLIVRTGTSAGVMTPPRAAWNIRKTRDKMQKAAKARETKAEPTILEEDDLGVSFGTDAKVAAQWFATDAKVAAQWFDHLKLNVEGMSTKKEDKVAAKKFHNRHSTAVLDYEGQYVLPNGKEVVLAEELPWYIQDSDIQGIQRLDQEMQLFHKFARPTEREQLARNRVVDELSGLIRKTLPDCDTETMGSHRSGLSMTVSDLDIRLFKALDTESDPEKAPRHQLRKQLLPDLRSLYVVLRDHPSYVLVNLRHARYPLISTMHVDSGLDIQIVCANDTEKARSTVKQYLQEDPDLSPLFALARTALEVRGLTDVFRGGLGSYSIFMMLVGCLRLLPNGPKSLGQKFMHFLSFYGNLDTYKTAIAVEPPAKYDKIHPGWRFTPKMREAIKQDERIRARYQLSLMDPLQPFLLCVQDPADPLNDLGHKAFGIKHIRETLKQLHTDLKRKIADDRHAAGEERHSTLLDTVVADAYSSIKKRRALIERYAP